MELKVEYVNIDSIEPYKNNARNHGEKDVQAIKRSIEEFGFNDPIGIWNNQIVEGHGRLLAAKELGMKIVPVIRLDEMTDEQRKAYALAHNKTAELSEWDFETLASELQDISTIDMSEFGFDIPELEEAGAEIIEDEAPDVPEEARAKLGDMYQLGEHRLICGDCTDIGVIDRLIDHADIDLLLTDPPYGINVVQTNKVGGVANSTSKTYGKVGGKNWVESKTYSSIIGDDTTNTARANYDVALTCTKNQIIFGGNYFTDFLPPSRCWIVWDKENTGNFADAELAWTSFDRGVRLYHFLWNGLCREGSREVEGKTRVHPTQKPVGMIANIIKDFSKDDDRILDCFGGSGSTLIACEQTGRKCYMCELDPHYVDVIIERWERFTGLKAELIEA